MRYFIAVGSWATKKRSGFFNIDFSLETYPSNTYIRTEMVKMHSDNSDPILGGNICVLNIIELTEEDFKSYRS